MPEQFCFECGETMPEGHTHPSRTSSIKFLPCEGCRRKDARIQTLETELEVETKSAHLHADLNRRAAKALGKPSEGEGRSWHDIPECIVTLMAENEQYQYAIGNAEEIHATDRARIQTLGRRLKGFEALCCGDCDMASEELRALAGEENRATVKPGQDTSDSQEPGKPRGRA